MKKLKLIIAVTGASGSIYANELLKTLVINSKQVEQVDIVFSEEALGVWKLELPSIDPMLFPFNYYKRNDFYAPCASGSNTYNAMIICPCSMGTLGRIANGISNDLITRTADVMLKERQTLILVAREAPYNSIHLQNMMNANQAGAIIFPATPSFYSLPSSIEEVIKTVTDRVLIKAGLDIKIKSWNNNL
ncbi:MAG: UbiX family flavin prenyltransferase [Bacteroidota bacterium]